MSKLINYIKIIFLSDKFTSLIRITLIIAIIEWILKLSFLNVFICFTSLLLTYSHIEIEKRYKIKIPKLFQVLIILFVFCSLFLWEIHSYYQRFYWWDTMLHWFSWLALWFIWFLIMYIFYKSWKFQAPVILIAIFSFSFWLWLWTVWEIFEYLIDQFFWLDMQKAKSLEIIYWVFDTRLWLKDTMQDLIIDWLWSFIASTSWYLYLKNGEKIKWFNNLVKSFEKENKNLFNS